MVSSHRITTLSSPIWCDDAASGRSHVVQVTRTVAEVRASVRAARRAGRRIGLVPTMGFLHDGHLSLIRRAAADCDDVIVSVFVNPTQFNDAADLAAYPRDEARDVELAVSAGATMVFAPPVEEVYPRHFAISVHVRGPITETLEGAVRGPEHFWGVATVVTKLFGMVQPDIAYFGQKDAQQCVVVSRLVADLDIPVELVICPTVREPDGLAMSSRNVRLRGNDRRRALALVEGLDAAGAAVRAGETDVTEVESVATKAMLARGVDPDYVAVVDPGTLAPLARIDGRALMVVAGHVGPVRLIDNAFLDAG
jgi:pantoate--beta-alanine ligase